MMNMREFLSHLHAFDSCQVAVIGDLMLDEYLWGHIERISPEAPVPILNIVRREVTLGGAGNVVENLRSLGVRVTALGVIGHDETGKQVLDLLNGHSVDVSGVIPDAHRKSTRKVRLMSLEHGQQVFRLDEESTLEVAGDIENHLINMIRAAADSVQVILCSDYMKGALTKRVLAAAFAAARKHGICCIVAPKDSNPQKYYGAGLLMPNVRELAQLVGTRVDGEGWLSDASWRLMERLCLEALVVTRGSEGMSLFEAVKGEMRRVDVPTMAQSVYDVTGAGDTAVATFAAAIAAGADRETAVRLANIAAGIKVGKRGTATVNVEEMHKRLREEEFLLSGGRKAQVTGPARARFDAETAPVQSEGYEGGAI
jgi:D-beta-D-heptose 7-phosphate kinase/D-beta-D-heptose 1-phosphate adenosyltransferase